MSAKCECPACQAGVPFTGADVKKWADQTQRKEIEDGQLDYYWLSFADGNRPRGQQFLGCIIVWAFGMMDAIRQTNAMGINPGGEVLSMRMSDLWLPPEWIGTRINVLMTDHDFVRATDAEISKARCGDFMGEFLGKWVPWAVAS